MDEIESLRLKLRQLEEEKSQIQEVGADCIISAEEIDRRSIYVGNVEYSSTPEDLAGFFSKVSPVNRVTILCNALGQSKGFAYVEFAEPSGPVLAKKLEGSTFNGRPLKVSEKRTNIPGRPQSRQPGSWPRPRRSRRFSPYRRPR
eukprot:NODE_5576_length_661_cov_49.431373_g5197_i0.p1 GENE.NODE_5576_length_661_cov_49.431373_g5197_i0~~NODE_5576_length_661_cov_49.431373_g5197_i0.p1  ORF type:complete len:145 (+),score=11.01 NODE_5576_length_661_cov_49.431373_g5197_i0:56-490(+)